MHLVGGSSVPNGITSGWDQVRVGSGEPSGGFFPTITYAHVSLFEDRSQMELLEVEWEWNGS